MPRFGVWLLNSETKLQGFKERLSLLIGAEQPFAWASRIGIPGATFNRMWNDGTAPKADHLATISKATGCSIDWLLTGEGDMRRGLVEYPLGETLKNGDILSDTVQVATATAPPGVNGIEPTKVTDQPFAWFHEWIDEELAGKSMSEIMRFAVKIKAELDKEREG